MSIRGLLAESFPYGIWRTGILGLAMLAAGAVSYGVDYRLRQEQASDALRQHAGAVMADLERSLDIPRALAAHVAVNTDITQSELAEYVRSVMGSRDLSFIPKSIQLAPNGIVTYEVPWTGGPHIGHDLFADPHRKYEALTAAHTQTTVIAGPLTLKQGGTALIARHPVSMFTNPESTQFELWGLATILIDWAPVEDKLRDVDNAIGGDLYVTRKNGDEIRVIYPADGTKPAGALPVFKASFPPGLIGFYLQMPMQPGGLFYLLWTSMSLALLGIAMGIKYFDRRTRFEESKRLSEAHQLELEDALKVTQAYLKAGLNSYTVQNENFEFIYASEEALRLLEVVDIQDIPAPQKLYADMNAKQLVNYREMLRSLPVGKRMMGRRPARIRTSSGKILLVNWGQRWFPASVGGGHLLMTSFEDVTALVEERGFNQELLNKSPAIILTENSQYQIITCSDAWVARMGFSRQETVGREFVDFFLPEQRKAVLNARQVFSRGHTLNENFEATLLTKSGERVEVQIHARLDRSGSEQRTILSVADVTDFVNARRELTRLVEHDELTGLLTRRGMRARFEDGLRTEDMSLFAIDLDHFKSVNDSFGHEAGDALLKAVGKTMAALTMHDGHAVRLGGEEFAIIRPWHGWQEALDFGNMLREAVAETRVEINSRMIQRTASIGCAYLQSSGELSSTLNLGDLVLREAKIGGRNKVVLADKEMIAEMNRRGTFIQSHDLQRALEEGELYCAVQPIWNVEDNRIEGFEALIRWLRPSGEMVMPSQFVDVLYEVIREPKYAELNNQLWSDALGHLADYPDAYVSFNFKLEELAYEGAATDIHNNLTRIKDHPARKLVVELSEAALDKRVNTDVLNKELHLLRSYGYRIALDDFGVESSNIKRLQDFPIDVVKIDKSLIDEIVFSERTRTTLQSIAHMLDTLEIKSIVEGVETEAQSRTLRDMNFVVQQGYVHAKPMRPEMVKPSEKSVGLVLSMAIGD